MSPAYMYAKILVEVHYMQLEKVIYVRWCSQYVSG